MKILLLLPAALLIVGCGENNAVEDTETGGVDAGQPEQAALNSSSSGDSQASGGPSEKVDPSEAGAKALLGEFMAAGADHAELSAALTPNPDDYSAAFIGDGADKAAAGYQQAWEKGQIVLKAGAGQTELLLWKATTEELNAWTGDAKDYFPGGYREIATHLKPGVTWYRFKFVEPGETLGMAYDGLVCVNGRWTIFPKPWRVLR